MILPFWRAGQQWHKQMHNGGWASSHMQIYKAKDNFYCIAQAGLLDVGVATFGEISADRIGGKVKESEKYQPQVDRINRSIAKMIQGHPWWASLLLNLRRSVTERVPTMATDGSRLLINPNFVDTLTDKEIMGVLMHETAHVALIHPYRRQHREPLRWNIACDAAANALLEADGIELPKGCVPAAPMGMLSEEIYENIHMQKISMQDLMDSLGDGEEGEEDGDGQGQAKGQTGGMTARDWKEAVSSMRGIQPAGISRLIEEAHKPVNDWKQMLAAFASATIQSADHTWTRLSRRVKGAPGKKRDPNTKIAVCVDTSGSIDNELLNSFANEAKSVFAVLGIEAWIIACDAVVHKVYEPGEDWNNLPGGGGTDFVPALRKAVELGVDAAIYFTDGDGNYGDEPSIPVLWAMPSGRAPYGQTILLTREG